MFTQKLNIVKKQILPTHPPNVTKRPIPMLTDNLFIGRNQGTDKPAIEIICSYIMIFNELN